MVAEGPAASLALVQVRRSLDGLAGRAGEERGHLASHFRRWRDSLGRAERSSIVAAAKQTPHLRTSLVSPSGEDLLFRYISPAFRVHALERERLIGRPTTESFDLDYARACAANTQAVMAAKEPALDEVRATVKIEPGVSLAIHYRRLVLPYMDGNQPFAVCASEALAA